MTMTTLWNTYSNEVPARRAVEALLGAGVPARGLRLLIGSREHDVREEPVGEFGRLAEPDEPVGTFANVPRLRGQGTGGFAGDPDRQRKGTFADADRDVIVGYERDRERSHVTGDDRVRRLLRAAALEEPVIDRIVAELREGNAVVVAEIADIAPAQARARLDRGGRAA
jgi:hypothetical protein